INGKKMSKSRGTFINARTYLNNLNPNYLRYYYAAKLGPSMDDIDMNLDDFIARVNSDLVGKLVNIASRCSGFIEKHFGGRLAETLDDSRLFAKFADASGKIAGHYESREYSKAMRIIMTLADEANRYIERKKPWAMAKDKNRLPEVQAVCTQGLNMFRSLMVYLTPVIPGVANQVQQHLNEGPWTWQAATEPLLGHTISEYKPLLTRIDKKQVERMVEQSKEPASGGKSDEPEITIDEFARLDMRIARIQKAEPVDGADKLLRLTLDLGSETRTVFAGIKSAYEPDELQGRLVIAVVNLQARKMRFGVSEGMVLAAGPGGDDIFLLSADDGAEPGMRVT
ncbi:MAG: methionine--tRNA ligase subunit beta, partial [Woeseiaceae bacterium]